MLPNTDRSLYEKFKSDPQKTGYRIPSLRNTAITDIRDIVDLAHRDVSRTLTGIGRDPQQSAAFRQVAVDSIRELLAAPSSSQSEFDEWHDRVCQRCLVPGVATVHYGQAQKLVNMSLKYLYNEFAHYRGVRNHLGYPDGNLDWFFHLPIDSQIRDHLATCYGFAHPRNVAWSKWGRNHYLAFQVELRGRLNPAYRPLEIDYLLWNAPNVSIAHLIAAPAARANRNGVT